MKKATFLISCLVLVFLVSVSAVPINEVDGVVSTLQANAETGDNAKAKCTGCPFVFACCLGG